MRFISGSDQAFVMRLMLLRSSAVKSLVHLIEGLFCRSKPKWQGNASRDVFLWERIKFSLSREFPQVTVKRKIMSLPWMLLDPLTAGILQQVSYSQLHQPQTMPKLGVRRPRRKSSSCSTVKDSCTFVWHRFCHVDAKRRRVEQKKLL